MRPRLLLTALPALGFGLTPASTATAQGPLGDRVKHLLELADKGSLAGVWELGHKLSELGDAEDSLAKAIRAHANGRGPEGVPT